MINLNIQIPNFKKKIKTKFQKLIYWNLQFLEFRQV